MSDIKHTVGMKRMHELLRSGMQRASRIALRCYLDQWDWHTAPPYFHPPPIPPLTSTRWGDLAHLSAYVALLLHCHEFSLLNCTLASMPELAVDEKMLEEIKDVRRDRCMHE